MWQGEVSLLWAFAIGSSPRIKLFILTSINNHSFQGFSSVSAKWYFWQRQTPSSPSYKGSRHNSPGWLLPFSLLVIALCQCLTPLAARRGEEGKEREGKRRQPQTPIHCLGSLGTSQASGGQGIWQGQAYCYGPACLLPWRSTLNKSQRFREISFSGIHEKLHEFCCPWVYLPCTSNKYFYLYPRLVVSVEAVAKQERQEITSESQNCTFFCSRRMGVCHWERKQAGQRILVSGLHIYSSLATWEIWSWFDSMGCTISFTATPPH